jgi:predicted permease
MFTLVDQILLRLLPVDNPRELVQLRVEGGRFGGNNGDGLHTFSYPIYKALKDRNEVFSGLTGQRIEAASLTTNERSEQVSVGMVTGDFFDVIGVRPHRGRLLTPADDLQRDGHPLAVLQYHFWQNRFGGRNEIVGSQIRLNGTSFTVIGVAQPEFEGTSTGLPVRIWVPVMMKRAITPTWDAMDDERLAWFYLFGRLKKGMSVEQAQASLRVLYRQRQEEELKGEFFQKFPDLRERFLRQTFLLEPASNGDSNLRTRFERPLVLLQVLVGLVLLIACANVAGLLLARSAARQREFAIRAALGASRRQIAGQLLGESLILAIAGGVAGILLSIWITRALIRLLPFDPANMSLTATPDLRVLGFTIAVSLLTALFFGLAPAWQDSRVSPGTTLKEEAGSIAGTHGHVRLRKLLVGLQVALSTVLLVGAGMFARTLENLKNVDLGFRTENVIMFGVRPATVYEESRKLQVYRDLIQGLQTVPGVRAVGANSARLLTGGRWDSNITLMGYEPKNGQQPGSYFNSITPGYFGSLGIPVLAGRDINWSDFGSDRKRCLVNEAFVKKYLQGQNPVGRLMAQGREKMPDMEIIGVFGNARYDNVRDEIPIQTFVALSSDYLKNISGVTVYARTEDDPGQVMSRLREQVRKIDSNLVISDMRTLNDQLNMRLANERMLSFLSIGFALLATLLAVVGLYGVLAFVVTRRTREIGLRVALGAPRARVIALVIREMSLVILLGLAAGVVGAAMSGKYIETQLFGLKANDPGIYILSALALFAASSIAAWIPAWRACRIDPIRALRQE